jgi:hypothetical protein
MGKWFKKGIICLIVLMWGGQLAWAKVSADEAKKLGVTGTPLTPVGAERAGNKDGTIPEWKGGITKPPAGYKKGDYHPLPFPEDKKLFTITAENYEQYKDLLTDGVIALFKTYPKTFKMNVYPTHRTASCPEWVYKEAIANASSAELVEGGNGFKGARATSPFPIPQNGQEAIWNHVTHYRGFQVGKYGAQAAPTRNGDYTIMKMVETILLPFADPKATRKQIERKNIFGYFLQIITSPARLAGTALLIHEYIDQVKTPRKAWTYNTGLRRVRRAPNVAYDYPGTASDGLRTTDDWDFYNGAPDRYEWKLIGKKEKFVAYNCYQLHSNKVKYADILKPGHINPDLVRYERHRVWVVEANLKKGIRHLYKKRVFYLDEDSWASMAAEMYDTRDQLWRVVLAHSINYYEVPTLWSTLDVYHDLQAGRYLATNLDNEEKMFDFSLSLSKRNFTSGALRRTGIR